MKSTDNHQILFCERLQRDRAQAEQGTDLQSAINLARTGQIRNYVQIQWPEVQLDDWQWDILESLFDPTIRRVFVKGNTGCGKGAAAGIACCAYFHIWDDAKIIITRDSLRMAQKIAFGEVDKWWRLMKIKPPGQLLTSGIYDHKQHSISLANPKHIEGFRGAHSPHVLFWFDEATAPNLEDKYKLANTQAKKFLALSNPSTLSGSFRDAFPSVEADRTQTIVDQYGKTRCITVSGWECTNVREKCLEQPVAPLGGIEISDNFYPHGTSIPAEHFIQCTPRIPGQTCYDEFMSLLNDPDPLIRNVYALGKFPDQDPEKQVILPEWLVEPVRFWTRWNRLWHRATDNRHVKASKLLNQILPVEGFGLDVAASRFGDTSVLAAGGRYGIRAIHECQFSDTQQTMEWVLETAFSYGIDLKQGFAPIAIDWGGGYGNAVGDPLKKRNVHVIEIHGNSRSDFDSQKYANKRAELYGEAGRRLDPAGDFRMIPFGLPDNERLRAELIAPQKIYSGHDGAKYYITPKGRRGADENYQGKTLRETLGRSPDRADAVVYCLYALRDQSRRRLIVA
ncbi:hypothetical protein Enr10x_58340 [Gimesia panareensis]|uniref:Terminase-like family protein n=1 Tax=Gimesia panareensis TaxID=2527978 RepID=A0A517QFQ1_9PLAN|nr:hypothetical protein [Gimesia panareensis]QDT30468.1 hypothetical protein Enr10x_58340 [Gimesia panareensis]